MSIRQHDDKLHGAAQTAWRRSATQAPARPTSFSNAADYYVESDPIFLLSRLHISRA